MNLMARRFLAGLTLLVVSAALAPALERESAVARMRADLTFLASDACEGRGPGTAGIDKTADYVAAAFTAAGLKPAMPAGEYFQPFYARGMPTPRPGAGVGTTARDGAMTPVMRD